MEVSWCLCIIHMLGKTMVSNMWRHTFQEIADPSDLTTSFVILARAPSTCWHSKVSLTADRPTSDPEASINVYSMPSTNYEQIMPLWFHTQVNQIYDTPSGSFGIWRAVCEASSNSWSPGQESNHLSHIEQDDHVTGKVWLRSIVWVSYQRTFESDILPLKFDIIIACMKVKRVVNVIISQ